MLSRLLALLSSDALFRRARDGFFAFLLAFAGVFLLALFGSPYSADAPGRLALFSLPPLAFLLGVLASPSSGRSFARNAIHGALAGALCAGLLHFLAAKGWVWIGSSTFLSLWGEAPASLWPASLALGALWGLGCSISRSGSMAGRVFSIRAVLPEEASPADAFEMIETVRSALPSASWGEIEPSDSPGASCRLGGILLIAEPAPPAPRSGEASASQSFGDEIGDDDSDEPEAESREWIIALLWDPGWRVWLSAGHFAPQKLPRELSRELAIAFERSGHFSRVDILS